MGCIFEGISSTDDPVYCRKVTSGRKLAGAIVLMVLSGNKSRIGKKEKERSRIRAVQMDNFFCVLRDWINCQMH